MINFLEATLRRPRTVLTVMVVLLFAGVSAYINLPKESMPNIDVPYLYVSASMTGVSPRDAEQMLARPIEQELRDLDGLANISSTATTGHASIFLEFDINFDKDQAMSDTRERVERVRSQLPSDADDPTVNEIDIQGFPTITVSVFGDVPERTLTRYAEELQDELENNVSTARDVTLSGAREEVLEVVVDQLRLESYNLTTNELFDALARNNLIVPAGSLDTGQGRFDIEVPGLISSAQDVQTLPLKSVDGTVITFSDVATINRTFKDATEFTRVNGAPALILGVNKATGTNIIENSRLVRETVERVTADWPAAVQVSYVLDQAVSAEEMLLSLENSVMTAIVLVMIVAVALLGLRPALLIGLSIPVSFMTSFFILQMLGITVNMMIMFGLVLTVGMLVDSAVVMVEYAVRKISEGMSRKEAFIRAARLMFVPILSSMATTIAAFLPLLLWPGIIGRFMSYFPIMVIVTLTASLITSMIFIPVVGGIIARWKVSEEEQEKAKMLSAQGAATFDHRNMKGPVGAYLRVLAFSIRHPILVLVLMVGSIGAIFTAYAANPTGVVAFPVTEPEYGTVAVTGIGNYSPVEVRDMLIEVEEAILPVSGIKEIVMNFGSTGALGTVPPDTIGNFQLELAAWKDRLPAEQIFEEIRARTADISGIGVEVSGLEGGPPAGKDINVRVETTRLDDLVPAVEQVRDFVENELGNTTDVEDGRALPGIDWLVTVDREQAARFGVGVRELSPYVQLVTSGVTIGTYRPEDVSESLDIVVRLPQDQRTFDALDSLRIVTPQGLVPVSNFISREAVPTVADISRTNGLYTMSVLANVEGTNPETGEPVMALERVEELRAWIDGQDWADGVTFEFGGADEQTAETTEFLSQAGVGVLFLMFLILLTQFNSFYQVFLTLSTVLMSTAGVVLGMLVTGQSFSAIMTGIGVISLAGIVVNNSIILIDTFNRLREEGVEAITATLMTAAQRLRPIMLTTITTVMGLVPMAAGINFDFFNRTLEINGLSGAWWSQLTTAVISGLTFSTVLTLIVVPVMLAAPTLWARQLGAIKRALGGLMASIVGLFRRPTKATTPDGSRVEVPDEHQAPLAAQTADGLGDEPADTTGLVEKEKNGVTVVSRQAAE
ncbi:efflux RND transporter permease subunit [Pelagibacterium montanilacus]|uniref:efflux RND transporter permease subunit n=1 Tax=Pelagibacterium montanilacus TaxID=2185280 RepID=UPI000F8F2E4E|nr:efflux RND transporter permease subunit [Pelagibacterium montanilacus]